MNRKGQVSGELVLIGAACLGLYLAGVEVVRGAKWLGHETKAGVHKILHPHQKTDPVKP